MSRWSPQKSCPAWMAAVSPAFSGALQSVQVKQFMWKMRSLARMTSSVALSPSPHLAHLLVEKILKRKMRNEMHFISDTSTSSSISLICNCSEFNRIPFCLKTTTKITTISAANKSANSLQFKVYLQQIHLLPGKYSASHFSSSTPSLCVFLILFLCLNEIINLTSI